MKVARAGFSRRSTFYRTILCIYENLLVLNQAKNQDDKEVARRQFLSFTLEIISRDTTVHDIRTVHEYIILATSSACPSGSVGTSTSDRRVLG